MNIADNILKYHLRNMYFIAGTACGGKTTLSRRLAEKYGFPLYSDLMNLEEHKLIVSDEYQPAMAKTFTDWNEYFNRPYREYAQWLTDTIKEDFEMVLIDLVAKCSGQTVIVDVHIPLEKARRLFDHHRIVFLIASPALVVQDNLYRDDHKQIYDCIMRLPEPERALRNVEQALAAQTNIFLDQLKQTDWYYIERDENSTVEKILSLIEQHFELV